MGRRLPTTAAVWIWFAVVSSLAAAGCAAVRTEPGPDRPMAEPEQAEARERPRILFDGASLAGWEVARFGGDGEVEVDDGRLILGAGERLTGVTWAGDALPRSDYELRLEAARLDGVDFFCGLTFPVGDRHATLVLGGWGGATTGLSNIDGQDASSNETTSYRSYETGRFYAVRLRVEPERIRAWLDDEPVVDVDIAGRTVGIRPEMDPSRPLGLTSFATRAAIRRVELQAIAAR